MPPIVPTPEVSVIIVSWNARDHLRRCLDSLRKGTQSAVAEIIVVDNDSTDGSPEMVSEQYPETRLVQTGANLGFAKGNNAGIDVSRGKYLCLVNSDVEVFESSIQTLCEVMDRNPAIGLAGPRVFNADGTAQSNCRNAPTIWNSLCRALSLDTLFPRFGLFRDGLALFPNSEGPTDVDVLTGCFWFLRREAMETVGKLDAEFFMYGEDLDWCRRFHNAKWRVVYVPDARIIHYGGASSSDAPLKFFIELHRGQLQYWRKYHSVASSILYLLTFCAHNVLRVIGYSLLWICRPGKRSVAGHKIHRSMEGLKWLVTEGYRCCIAEPAAARSVEIRITPETTTREPGAESHAVIGLKD